MRASDALCVRAGSLLQVVVVACDDGRIKAFNALNGELMTELQGHEDAVQAVAFDQAGSYLVSCGSDNTFRLWA